MNYYQDCKNKRVSDNTNLHLYYDSFYRGIPIQTHKGPLIENYLARTYDTIMDALISSNRIFAVRVDLRFPATYHALDNAILGNEYFDLFKRNLKNKLDKAQATSQSQRLHPHNFKIIAAREYNQHESKPHFHVLILVNGNAFNATGDYSLTCSNLFSRIHESWAQALGLNDIDCIGITEIPPNGQYRITKGDQQGFEELFNRASYFCKAYSKEFNDGYHPFIGSRHSTKHN